MLQTRNGRRCQTTEKCPAIFHSMINKLENFIKVSQDSSKKEKSQYTREHILP